MSEVSLKRFYFALFDDGLTLKTFKLAFIGFCLILVTKCDFENRSLSSEIAHFTGKPH